MLSDHTKKKIERSKEDQNAAHALYSNVSTSCSNSGSACVVMLCRNAIRLIIQICYRCGVKSREINLVIIVVEGGDGYDAYEYGAAGPPHRW